MNSGFQNALLFISVHGICIQRHAWSNISQSYVARPLIYLVSYMAPVKIFMETERLRPVKIAI